MKNEKSDFWTGKNYAVVGVSDRKSKLGNAAFKELQKRGYKVYPVNQSLNLFGDQMCYHSLSHISDPLDRVIIITGPEGAKKAMQECSDKGLKKVWLFPGSKCDQAMSLAKENKIELIYKVCPLLYLKPVKFPHSLHRWIVKVFGKL